MRLAKTSSRLICSGLAIAALAALVQCRLAVAVENAMPLFLAPRPAEVELSPELRRAAQLRQDQRVAAVANANLKWKPYRPAPQTVSAEQPTPAVADTQTPTITKVSLEAVDSSVPESLASAGPQALPASPIATTDGQLRFRRVPARGSRGKLREGILRVSSDSADPFADMPEEDPKKPDPDESYPGEKKPAGRGAPDLGEPRPIPSSEDPFPSDNYGESLPEPSNTRSNQSNSEPPFASADASPNVSCAQDKRECEAALIKLRNTTLDKLDITLDVTGQEGYDFPCECPLTGEFDGRNWACTNYTWKASLAVHKPLYFEEVQLERYGHSLNPLIGPLWSGVHFFLLIPTLPYQMSLAPPNECQYVLGYYRPGNCAPYLLPPVPLSFEAAFIEATSIVGGFWILR